MKKKVMIPLAFLIVLVVISISLVIRGANYNYGKEKGYLIGYSIGYADKNQGEKQDSQELAGEIVPYEIGNAKWKGFMMGFSEGYSHGNSDVDTDSQSIELGG